MQAQGCQQQQQSQQQQLATKQQGLLLLMQMLTLQTAQRDHGRQARCGATAAAAMAGMPTSGAG
jgi:hypothetical protein